MRRDQLHSLPHLKQIRSRLRQEETPAEEAPWPMLRGKELEGQKFRRQRSIDDYVVDFYCASDKLVIELDGSVHDSPEVVARDKNRDKTLRNWGFQVLRFRNEEVLNQVQTVLEKIKTPFSNFPSK